MSTHLEPDSKHPITVSPLAGRVTVSRNGQTLADSVAALGLAEADYPVAVYVPRSDVDENLLVRSEHGTHCPYKGDASYFSFVSADDRVDDIAWSYEDPAPAVEAIRDHVAFYPQQVEVSRHAEQ